MTSWYPLSENFNLSPNSFLSAFAALISEWYALSEPLISISEDLLPSKAALTNESALPRHYNRFIGLQVELYLDIVGNPVLILPDERNAHGCREVHSFRESGAGF